ncbi:hypothetical protein D3C80_1722350 [compost metagenome]
MVLGWLFCRHRSAPDYLRLPTFTVGHTVDARIVADTGEADAQIVQASARLIDYHGDCMLRPGRVWVLGGYDAKYAVAPPRRIA